MKRTVERPLLARTRAPILAFGLGWALTACGDGLAQPLVPIPEVEGSEGGSGNAPEPAYCDAAENWPEESTQAEQELFAIVGVLRRIGLGCSGERLNPAPPLLTDTSLRCAARLHSLDMAERAFFRHDNPDGLGPQARIELTGYHASVYGESIARYSVGPGTQGAWGLLEELMPGSECENLFDPAFTVVGIGHHQGLWTLDFAGP